MPLTYRAQDTPASPLLLGPPFTGVTSVMNGGTPSPSFGCSALDSREQCWINASTGSAGSCELLLTPCFTISPGVPYFATVDLRVITISAPVLDLELETCAGVIIGSPISLATAVGRSLQTIGPFVSPGSVANVRMVLRATAADNSISVFSLALNRN